MSSGEWHYKQAENLLHDAENADPAAKPAEVMLLLAFADVHRGLAQVAATAEAGGLTKPDTSFGGSTPWARVLRDEASS